MCPPFYLPEAEIYKESIYEGKKIIYVSELTFYLNGFYDNLEILKKHVVPCIGIGNWPWLIIETTNEIYVVLHSNITVSSTNKYLWRSVYNESVSPEIVKFIIQDMKDQLSIFNSCESCNVVWCKGDVVNLIENMELNYFWFSFNYIFYELGIKHVILFKYYNWKLYILYKLRKWGF